MSFAYSWLGELKKRLSPAPPAEANPRSIETPLVPRAGLVAICLMAGFILGSNLSKIRAASDEDKLPAAYSKIDSRTPDEAPFIKTPSMEQDVQNPFRKWTVQEIGELKNRLEFRRQECNRLHSLQVGNASGMAPLQ